MVCCVLIKHEVRTWGCPACFNLFHLYCVRKWAKSPAAATELPPPPNSPPDYHRMLGWRCPACQHVSKDVPQEYFCFCGKVKDPEFDRLETPHSCGEVCGRPRGKGGSLLMSSYGDCPHMCTLLCHPGPCPPCTAFVTKFCDCGKNRKKVKCNQDDAVKCEEACGKQLNCEKHFCEKVCHKAPCAKCSHSVIVTCCCGQSKQDHECSKDVLSTFICNKICEKDLGCNGGHKCEEPCHPGECGACPLLPSAVTHCPCGKSALSAMSVKEAGQVDLAQRMSCLDPVPVCSQTCGKLLPCGDHKAKRHTCSSLCHVGPCPPCDNKSNIPCFCGATTRKMDCDDMLKKLQMASENGMERNKPEDRKFFCDRRCNKKMFCGRHKCGRPCCSLKEHVCQEKCGKKLSCRRHVCEESCHKGNCDTCPNVSFDELPCACGASVLPPPIHCGTRPPPCSQLCRRVHECMHEVTHTCHSEAKCPPCPALLSKMCMGSHKKRHNIPCYLKDVSCGMTCKKPLPGCNHFCQKTCHKGSCVKKADSPLDTEDIVIETDSLLLSSKNHSCCLQPCMTPRVDCGHPCNAPCHGKAICPKTVCKLQIKVNCRCGRKSKVVACPWGASQESHVGFQKLTTEVLASKFKDIQMGNAVDITDLQTAVSGLKVKNMSIENGTLKDNTSNEGQVQTVYLECDDDCEGVERNRRFAEALALENADYNNKVDTSLPPPGFTPFLKEQARKNAQNVSSVEEKIAELVNEVISSKKPKKSYSFPPMKSLQRQVVHELAETYGCTSISYDDDPKRNVVVTAFKDKSAIPSMTLTAAVQREINPRAPVPIPLGSKEEELRSALAAEKQRTSLPAWANVSSANRGTVSNTSAVPGSASTKDFFDYFDGM